MGAGSDGLSSPQRLSAFPYLQHSGVACGSIFKGPLAQGYYRLGEDSPCSMAIRAGCLERERGCGLTGMTLITLVFLLPQGEHSIDDRKRGPSNEVRGFKTLSGP